MKITNELRKNYARAYQAMERSHKTRKFFISCLCNPYISLSSTSSLLRNMYPCTLPGCVCSDFTAGKTQLKNCDTCKHGWTAHDSITEAQAKKIRIRGVKNGTPCQSGNCACGNYQRPPGVAKTSWLAACENCKHSETEHRYPTKLDKLKKHNHERAADNPCVGCEMHCPGFHTRGDGQVSKKCSFCNHMMDTHRPAMPLDDFISEELDACSNLRCHCPSLAGGRQVRSSCRSNDVDDDAYLNGWLEPTNIDRDEEVSVLGAAICQCKGFVFDDKARICNQYFGFPQHIVAEHIPNLACQLCAHAMRNHRQHTAQELKQLDARKVNNLTFLSVTSLPASSRAGFHDNVCLSHQMNTTLDSHKMLLAVTKQMKSEDSSNTKSLVYMSSATFANHHHRERILSASSGVTDADDTHSEEEEEKENEEERATPVTKTRGKRRRKMSKIMEGVKKKIKRRKLVSRSSTLPSESEMDAIDPGVQLSRSVAQLVAQMGPVTDDAIDVTAVAMSQHQAEANYCAVTTDDRRIIVHRLCADSFSVFTESRFPDGVSLCTSVSWLHFGKAVVSGHTCGTALLWKLADTPSATMESSVLSQSSSRSRVTSICISGDDRFIAVGYRSSEVVIFDAKKAPSRRSFDQASSMFSPDSHVLSRCSILYGAVLCMAWHPTKFLLVVGGEDDQITVFFMKKPTSQAPGRTLKHYFSRSPRRPAKMRGFHQCAILKGHKSFVGAVTFDPSGNFLLSAGWDGQLLIWNTADIDDAIESRDPAASEIVCSSGFVMGRSLRGQSSGSGMQRPFVPQSLTVLDAYAVLMLRTSVNRVSLAMYELPRKCLDLTTKVD
ncbi:uncharacterized protein [Diadema antillarum]|uniref:uncharacterized protein n=1 Tax=Diadema antillarum TaxID=105358 RepID=UPI003A83F524